MEFLKYFKLISERMFCMGEFYFSTLAEVKIRMERDVKSAKSIYRLALILVWIFIAITLIQGIIKSIPGNWIELTLLIIPILLGMFLTLMFSKFCKSQIRESEDNLEYPLINNKFSSMPVLIGKDNGIVSVKGFGTAIKMIDGEKIEIEYSKDLSKWESIKIDDGIIFNSSTRIYLKSKDSDFFIYPCGVSSFEQDILKIKK